MLDKDILYEAIKKAERNGYKCSKLIHPVTMDQIELIYESFSEMQIIFSHDFAKAFWGEEDGYSFTGKVNDVKETHILSVWEYHLQQIVLEEEPLKYLERFLND